MNVNIQTVHFDADAKLIEHVNRKIVRLSGLHDRILREVERPLILLTLAATRGNQIKAAHVLGINRNTLRKKIRDLEIQVMRGLG